jgi:hypothetical protein
MNKDYTPLPMTHADACRRISAVCACVYDNGLPKIFDHPYDYEDTDMDWDEHVVAFFRAKLENAYYDTGNVLKDVKSVDKP